MSRPTEAAPAIIYKDGSDVIVDGDVLDPSAYDGNDDVSAALALKAPLSPIVRTITAATDTITQADNGKIILCNRGTGQTLTVTTPISAGFNVLIVQKGAGLVTIADDATAAVNQRDSLTDSAGQFAIMSLVAYEADVLTLGGDLA